MKIDSEKQMREYWKQLSKTQRKILLYWDLGAGKTHFVKWFAQWLNINQVLVQSPTYTYINRYDNKLLHIDMYRLESENDLIEKGILDEIQQYEYICIERPKFEKQYIDDSRLIIRINKISMNEREIIVTPYKYRKIEKNSI